jgi:hypothetical protein
MPAPDRIHHHFTRVMSFAMVLLGAVLVIRTLAAGGGPLSVGVVLGALFVVAGGARLYLQARRS